MRRLFLLIFTVSGLFFALDAQVLKGKIMDDMTGNPVSDASILLIPGNSGTHAHPDGSYQLTPVAGNYSLEVNHLGYYPENRRITLRSNDTLVVDFLLKAKIFEQEQVVITANKVERERMAVPMNVSVLTSGIIAESHESNILPVISGEIPGLFITERGLAGFGLAGGSAGKISIRGVGGSDASFPVLLLIDGQPQFMGLMGHPIPDSYVSGDVEKVEVVKGPASILYGTNAMGGAINLITRKQTEEGFDLNARFTGGSYGTLKGHGSAGFSKKGLGILASYQHDQTDGHRPGSAFRLDNGN
ncbi:MAG TPA: TonB-dependent receptor, partial [Prolixibacteraceae bacterium]|nr:TonB-dependent receptor [Prolixibacteraceae bacterium]